MFSKSWLIETVLLELIIAIIAWCAWDEKLLTRKQALKHGWGKKKPYGTFSTHGGMWMDIVLISPLSMWISSNFARNWNEIDIKFSVCAAGTLSLVMVQSYRIGSREIDEFMARDDETLMGGWIHFAYMWFVITLILQFYFATDFILVGPVSAKAVTILLAIHVAVGIIQPPYATHGKLPGVGVYLQVLAAWAMLYGAWRHLVGQ